MHRMQRVVIPRSLILLTFLMQGCAGFVPHFERVKLSPYDDTVRVVLDRQGSIYPYETRGESPRFGKEGFSLAEHFKNSDCARYLEQSAVFELCELHHRTNTLPDFSPDYLAAIRDIETRVWQQAADRLFEISFAEGQIKDLGILIHGFNEEDPLPTLEALRSLLNEGYLNRKRKLAFLEVIWDGGDGISHWWKAQYSGPKVGFELRKLLNMLHQRFVSTDLPVAMFPEVHVMTHSSGAYVIGSTVGDVRDAYKDDGGTGAIQKRMYQALENMSDASEYFVPEFPVLNLAMFAAATPSDTFTGDLSKGNVYSRGIQTANTRVSLSMNTNDYALNKGFRLNNTFGASGMGANKEIYCNCADKGLTLKNIEHQAFDFDDNTDGGDWLLSLMSLNEHSMQAYEDNDAATDMIDMMLGNRHESDKLFNCPVQLVHAPNQSAGRVCTRKIIWPDEKP